VDNETVVDGDDEDTEDVSKDADNDVNKSVPLGDDAFVHLRMIGTTIPAMVILLVLEAAATLALPK
jgi:hypothetical protein